MGENLARSVAAAESYCWTAPKWKLNSENRYA